MSTLHVFNVSTPAVRNHIAGVVRSMETDKALFLAYQVARHVK